MKNDNMFAAMLAAAMLNDIETEKKKPTSDETVDFRKKAKKIGETLMQAYLGYMDAGFNEKQAFQLMMNAITK